MADAAAVSYGTAQSGHGPEPSSTQIQVRTPGVRVRMSAQRSVKVPWKMTATASALVQRYSSSSSV